MTAPLQQRFGPYTVQDKLGKGSFATVYRAEREGKIVALKLLRQPVDETTGARLQKEIALIRELRHPHIVPIYDLGIQGGRFFIVSRYLARGSLAARVATPTEIGVQESIRLLRYVSSALDFLASRGTLHGDLKLQNVLQDERGDAFISDVGFARAIQSSRLPESAAPYLAPEAAQGKMPLSSRADLYSLAAMAYTLLVGRYPFRGTPAEMVLQHINHLPHPPSEVNRALPIALDAVLLRGLAKRPEERYSSGDTFVEALARALSDQMGLRVRIDLAGNSAPVVAKAQPARSADEYVRLAERADDPAEAIAYLRQALALDAWHSKANRMLVQLEGARPPIQTGVTAQVKPDGAARKTAELKKTQQAAALKADARVSTDEQVAPAAQPDGEALEPLKKPRRKRKRTVWTYVTIASIVLLNVTLSLFVAFALGTDFAGKLRNLVIGKSPAQTINGTPMKDIPNVALTLTPSYNRDLSDHQATGDVMVAGDVHEYKFQATAGQELAINVQFVSLTAKNVGRNVGIIRPDGTNAEGSCQRDSILKDGSSVVFICKIDQSGLWRVRIYGIVDQSTGAYVVAVQPMAS
jgi:hypothetical protein